MSELNRVVAATLEGVLDLWSDADKWAQGNDAKDKEGMAVPVNSTRAASWCMRGAVGHVIVKNQVTSSEYHMESIFNATMNYLSVLVGRDIIGYNDGSSRTFEDMRLLVKQALHQMDDEPISDAPGWRPSTIIKSMKDEEAGDLYALASKLGLVVKGHKVTFEIKS